MNKRRESTENLLELIKLTSVNNHNHNNNLIIFDKLIIIIMMAINGC